MTEQDVKGELPRCKKIKAQIAAHRVEKAEG
jgi:hypothetical protein